MTRKKTVTPKAARVRGAKKQTPAPLTARCLAALKRCGGKTSDALAQALKAPARAVSKACSRLKATGRAHFTRSRAGEAVWRAGKGVRAR